MKKALTYCLLVFLNFCVAFTSFSQDNTIQRSIDSVNALLKSNTPDSLKLSYYIELAWMYRHKNTNLASAYADSAIAQAKQQHNYKMYWLGLNSKAEAYRITGQLEQALKSHQAALTLATTNHMRLKQAHSLNNISIILRQQRNYKDAKDYLLKAAKIYTELNDSTGILNTTVNLGNSYYDSEQFEEAITYFAKGVQLSKLTHNLQSLGNAYANLGHCYYYLNQKAKATENYYLSLAAREKYGNNADIADAYNNVGYMLFEEGKIKEANDYYQKSIRLLKEANDAERLQSVYSYLSTLHLNNKDYKLAYYYADTSKSYREKVLNQTNVATLNEMSQRFESEKKELQINNLSNANAFKEKENKRQQLFLLVIGAALIISLVLGVSVYKQYREKNKANQIIAHQKAAIEEKQKEILDSIAYAKRIQYALLASDNLLQQNLPEHFVLFKPKDVVSGDFYWATPTPEGFVYITADCTGHGVPGAFMSLLNISKLSQTINENKIVRPDLILNNVRSEIIKALNPEGSVEESKDGMDAVVCKLDLKNYKLEYASANNSFYIIRNGNLITCKADKMPVGKGHNDEQSFSYNEFSLEKGDTIYTFTDGFADQFGGPKGKKFKYKQLEEVLLSIHQKGMKEQRELLLQKFEAWKGSLEQVDDVCVIGVKI